MKRRSPEVQGNARIVPVYIKDERVVAQGRPYVILHAQQLVSGQQLQDAPLNVVGSWEYEKSHMNIGILACMPSMFS